MIMLNIACVLVLKDMIDHFIWTKRLQSASLIDLIDVTAFPTRFHLVLLCHDFL